MQLSRLQPSVTRTQHSRPIAPRRVATTCYCKAVAPARRSTRSGTSQNFGTRVVVVQPRQRQARSRATVAVEANLFSRLTRVVKAYIDSIVGNFEDPDKLLDRLVDEMLQDSMKMRQASAQALASQRQMVARQQNIQAGADQWLRRAELAVSRGQDDLAREALARRKAMQADADRMQAQVTAQKNACDQLTASVRMLEGKIQEARSKKETLKARAASAKSNIAVQELIGGLRSTSSTSFAAFEKMEEKVMALEAEAESTAAMSTPDALEARFSLLENGGVEDELRMLKSNQQSRQQLPERTQDYSQRPRMSDVLAKAPMDQIDYELEELRRKARV